MGVVGIIRFRVSEGAGMALTAWMLHAYVRRVSCTWVICGGIINARGLGVLRGSEGMLVGVNGRVHSLL